MLSPDPRPHLLPDPRERPQERGRLPGVPLVGRGRLGPSVDRLAARLGGDRGRGARSSGSDRYNQEDCSALAAGRGTRPFDRGRRPPGGDGTGLPVAGIEEIEDAATRRKFGDSEFALAGVRPDHEVLRTSTTSGTRCSAAPAPRVKVSLRRKKGGAEPTCRRSTKRSSAGCLTVCPHCGSTGFDAQLANSQSWSIDLKPFRGGVKRWVTRYRATGGSAAARLPGGPSCRERLSGGPLEVRLGLVRLGRLRHHLAAADQRGCGRSPRRLLRRFASHPARCRKIRQQAAEHYRADLRSPAGRPAEGASGPRRRDEGRRSKGPAKRLRVGLRQPGHARSTCTPRRGRATRSRETLEGSRASSSRTSTPPTTRWTARSRSA